MRAVALIVVATGVLVTGCGSDKACPVCPPAGGSAAPAVVVASKKVTLTEVAALVLRDMQANDAAAVHARFHDDMKQAISLDQLRTVVDQLPTVKGKLQKLTPRDVQEREGTFVLQAENGSWDMLLAIDEAGMITGLRFKEPEAAITDIVKSKPIGLPFHGTWKVFWGGDTVALNYHVSTPNQRRAADLVIVDANDKSHTGDGERNEDYFAYGKPILAVAAGKVILAVDGVPDNKPGELNPVFVPGNTVIIEHAPGLYSMYAHLIPGSVTVKAGAQVRAGQELGKCGNSGNSSEPHLHFQLQDGPTMVTSLGIEPVFANVEVTRDGATTKHAVYTWRKDDLVIAP